MKKKVGLCVFVCHQLTLAYTSPIFPAVHPGTLSCWSFFSPPHKNVEQKFSPLFFLLHFFSPLISPRFHSFSFRAAGSCPNSDATSLANMYNTETNGIPLSKEEGVEVGTDPVPHESLTPSTSHVYFYPPHPHTSVHSLRGEGEEGSALGRSRAVRNYDALVVPPSAPSF